MTLLLHGEYTVRQKFDCTWLAGTIDSSDFGLYYRLRFMEGRMPMTDLTGDFCTSRIETGRQKGIWGNVEEDVYAGADCAEAAAD
jgi:hypothetical protein